MFQNQVFKLALSYDGVINVIITLICLLIAKHYGVLQYF